MITPLQRNTLSLDVTFAENQPYYQHTLQGENLGDEVYAAGGSMGWQEILGTLPLTTLQGGSSQNGWEASCKGESPVRENGDQRELEDARSQWELGVEPAVQEISQQEHCVMNNPEATQRRDCAPLKVYSRRKIETIHPPQLSHRQHSQSSEPEVIIPESDSKFFYSSQGDLDIPIALRKGIRSCTQHPISKFV